MGKEVFNPGLCEERHEKLEKKAQATDKEIKDLWTVSGGHERRISRIEGQQFSPGSGASGSIYFLPVRLNLKEGW